jgi:hypothetical protein
VFVRGVPGEGEKEEVAENGVVALSSHDKEFRQALLSSLASVARRVDQLSVQVSTLDKKLVGGGGRRRNPKSF